MNKTFEYQIIGVHFGRLYTLRSLWAVDDNEARLLAGELAQGAVLVRMVERASPGRQGNI